MKRPAIIFALIAAFVSLSHGQWQQNPQVQTQTGPIYPPNPSYNFYSRSADSSPFQFDWASGHWDYLPIPYDSGWRPSPPQSPYVWNGNRPEYTAVQNSPGVGSVEISQRPAPSQNPTDDTGLWTPPTTRPEPTGTVQIVKFSGRIIGIKAMSMMGVKNPHLFLRLVCANGAKGTIDAGEQLEFPQISSPTDLDVTVTGKLGWLDGNLVLFADSITFGSHPMDVKREIPKSPAK